MKLRYCGNTYDPCAKDFYDTIMVDHMHGETQAEAVQRMRDWLKGRWIGEPQPTETFTVVQMKEMGMVGVYSMTIDKYTQDNPDLIVDYPIFMGKPTGLTQPIF